jgi:hypothetical protein
LTELPNGHAQITGGFDCSGLAKAAHAAVKGQPDLAALSQSP